MTASADELTRMKIGTKLAHLDQSRAKQRRVAGSLR